MCSFPGIALPYHQPMSAMPNPTSLPRKTMKMTIIPPAFPRSLPVPRPGLTPAAVLCQPEDVTRQPRQRPPLRMTSHTTMHSHTRQTAALLSSICPEGTYWPTRPRRPNNRWSLFSHMMSVRPENKNTRAAKTIYARSVNRAWWVTKFVRLVLDWITDKQRSLERNKD